MTKTCDSMIGDDAVRCVVPFLTGAVDAPHTCQNMHHRIWYLMLSDWLVTHAFVLANTARQLP